MLCVYFCTLLIIHCSFCCCIRHFHLVLKKSSTLLSHDFRVVAVNGDDVERIVDIRPAVYHGFLAGTVCLLIRSLLLTSDALYDLYSK